MRTIWKFPFTIADIVQIKMPKGAEVLHIEIQNGTPCLWAIVDPVHPWETRRFRVYGTGHYLNEYMSSRKGSYISPFQDGSFVRHIFESE